MSEAIRTYENKATWEPQKLSNYTASKDKIVAEPWSTYHLFAIRKARCLKSLFFSTPQFPYLYEDYPGGWHSYPTRKGFNVNTMIKNGDYTQGGRKTYAETASFLQSWLFSGVICDFFQIPAFDTRRSLCRME
jgi:hypothetical protein